jgi:ABC-type multidrug transport system ATPase subunit
VERICDGKSGGTEILRTEGLVKGYRGRSVQTGADLAIEPGEIPGLVGAAISPRGEIPGLARGLAAAGTAVLHATHQLTELEKLDTRIAVPPSGSRRPGRSPG